MSAVVAQCIRSRCCTFICVDGVEVHVEASGSRVELHFMRGGEAERLQRLTASSDEAFAVWQAIAGAERDARRFELGAAKDGRPGGRVVTPETLARAMFLEEHAGCPEQCKWETAAGESKAAWTRRATELLERVK